MARPSNPLYTVKRITNGKFAEIRRISDGHLRLCWTTRTQWLFFALCLALSAAFASVAVRAMAETTIIENRTHQQKERRTK
jgi:hypothetical protein